MVSLTALGRPARVALVTPAVDRDGGVAAHVVASASALAGAGYDPVIVAGRGVPESDLRVRTVSGLDRAGMADDLAGRVLQAVATESADVVQFHDLADPEIVARVRTRHPVIASVHGHAGCPMNTRWLGAGRVCERSFGPGCVASMALRGCAHTRDPRAWVAGYRATPSRLAGLGLADAVVCYSRGAQRHLADNGLTRTDVVPLIAEGAATIPPWPAAPRALFVGRVVQAKGLEFLLRAMPQVACPLDVVGDGWQAPELRRLARKMGLSDKVTFHGWRDRDGVQMAYAAASLVVMPSVWPEPFGLAGADALRHGRPVVASDTGGIRDWLDDGASGLLVPPGDPVRLAAAVNALAGDPARARAMGRHGAAVVARRFSAEAHVAALEGVYARATERWEAGRG